MLDLHEIANSDNSKEYDDDDDGDNAHSCQHFDDRRRLLFCTYMYRTTENRCTRLCDTTIAPV